MSAYTNLPEVTELISYALFSDYLKFNEAQKEIAISMLIE